MNLCTCECNPVGSPVLIDVSGNGFNLTDGPGGVNFDLNSDGITEHISWTTSTTDDAWLVLDHNGNRSIDDGQKLFGNFTDQPTPPIGEEKNGFLALAEFDKSANGGNDDGLIDNSDGVFSRLRLWQDTNHNGISEPSELHTLPVMNVSAVELKYKESKRTDNHGNEFRYRAKALGTEGGEVGRWAWDVFLVSQ